MNRRLQERMDECDNQWWHAFASEFFDDKATLTLTFFLDGMPKRYTIGRTLIPRFFRSIFDSGVADMYMVLRLPKDCQNATANCVTLDCEHTTMVMHHPKPVPTKVCAEGHLLVDFVADELMRIRSYHFAIRSHLEYIPKQAALQNPGVLEDLCKNTTRQGLTTLMLNYLKMCVVIEPMKELMSRQKAYSMDPRDCLKNCLFQKWQRMLNPQTEASRQTRKPRKRKNSSGANPGSAAQGAKKKTFASSDVMQVGEPILMGNEFGEEDERMITRLENHFDSPQPGAVKSEGQDVAAVNSFPNVSSPATAGAAQWNQQPISAPSSTSLQAGHVPHVKSEPPDPVLSTTPPMYTSPVSSST